MANNDRTAKAVEKEKNKREKLARIKSNEGRLEKAFCECFSTAAGKIVLKFIGAECGFLESSIYFDKDGLIKKDETIYNEARRNVYLTIRRFLRTRPDILIDVEIKQTLKEKD